MIRTKKYITGDYLEIEVFNVSSRVKPFARARKSKESSPAQKKLNAKNALRYFVRLVNSNFVKGDLTVELTYDNEHLPSSRDEVLKDVKNYLKRLKRIWNKTTDKPFKYIYVVSNHAGDDTSSTARPHVHLFLSGMDRDVVEQKWGKGIVNADRLQFDEYGVTGKALYVARQSKSTRSWGSSINLVKPAPIVSDRMMNRTQMDRIVNDPSDGAYIEKLVNKDNKTRWTFTDCLVEYDGRQLNMFGEDTGEGNGYSLLIRMRKESWRK